MADNASSNVIPLKIPPKTLNRTYKSQAFTVTYVPKEKKWKWTVTVVNKMVYSDMAPDQLKAIRAAEKFIDKTCGGK